MDIDVPIMIIKSFFLNIYTYYVFIKITNSTNKNLSTSLKILFASFSAMIIYFLLKEKINQVFIVFIMYLVQVCFLRIIFKDYNKPIMVTNLIANSITYIGFGISAIIEFGIQRIFDIQNIIINLILTLILEMTILIVFFRIKRFSKGFTFLKNGEADTEYIDIIMINISAAVVLGYCLFGNFYGDITKQILISFVIVGIITVIMIQKTLTLYYKQKLLARTIDDYKAEIEQKDKKIEELSEEKFKISKLNHEFYNRQKALEQKVNEFIKNKNLNMETAEELSPIKQIQNLSDEYSGKLENIKHLEKLSLTEIEEIDDMFKYMQAECKKNNIDFKLQVNGNIHHLINKLIPQDRLVTLIGDHIRDAIIAVNSSNNKFRSIVTFIGIKDNYYEFSVYDTGIEFEIETLVNLGTKPITTHKNTGGTGIGFITTFETLKDTKASLIIEEKHKEMDNDYTKAVNIKFDGKGEYRINSYRANEIKEKDKKGRIIIEK